MNGDRTGIPHRDAPRGRDLEMRGHPDRPTNPKGSPIPPEWKRYGA